MSQPATATSTGTSSLAEELRAIRLYLKAICRQLKIDIDTDNGATVELCPDCHTRPCTCNDAPEPSGTETQEPEPAPEPEPEPEYSQTEDEILRYGNGQPVSDNQAEIDAYLAFIQANRIIPLAVESLRAWCREQEQRRPNGNASRAGAAVTKTAAKAN
jgi:hypothetical protein